MSRRGESDVGGPGLPTEFAERVLDLVAQIPSGRVLTYGQVAGHLGSGAARAVGTVMARYGGGVPWHRVIRADGRPPIGHEHEALARYRQEGTPLRRDGRSVDLVAAGWAGPTRMSDADDGIVPWPT